MPDHLIPLDILARQVEQIRAQVDTVRQQARKHYLAHTMTESRAELITSYCNASDVLLCSTAGLLRFALTEDDKKEAAEAADRA